MPQSAPPPFVSGSPARAKIYHLHLRKTAGRSVHHAVFRLTGQEPAAVYQRLSRSPGTPVEIGGVKLGGWVSDLTKDFHYAYSHRPMYQLYGLDAKIFMLCCFRDPVNRFLSYWKMLKDYSLKRATLAVPHPALEEEMAHFDENILRCFAKTPPFHRMNQIYMFSEAGNYAEAVLRLRRVNLILETEDLQPGLDCLSDAMGRYIGAIPKVGVSNASADIDNATRLELRIALRAEYELIAEARNMRSHYLNVAGEAQRNAVFGAGPTGAVAVIPNSLRTEAIKTEATLIRALRATRP